MLFEKWQKADGRYCLVVTIVLKNVEKYSRFTTAGINNHFIGATFDFDH